MDKSEIFTKKLIEKFGEDILSEYTFSEYKKCNEKISITHNTCNTTFEMRPNDFLNGHRCPVCAAKKRLRKSSLTIESYKEKVREIYGDEYEILSDSITKLTDKIKIRHNKCGNVYEATARNLLRRMGCRQCSYEITGMKQRGISKPSRTRKTEEQFKEDLLNILGSDYELVSNYISSHQYVKIRHKTCNNVYDVMPHNIISHHTKCPYCVYTNGSEKENELLEFVKSIFPDASKKRIITPEYTLEGDICIEDKKLVIEFDGLYWHSEAKGKNSKFHLNKTNQFNNLGYRVIHIFEDEWDNKKELIKNKLLHIFNKDTSERFYARKCSIKEISTEEKNSFLNEYHIQGEDTSSIKLGLFSNEKLIAVMTFIKPRIALGRKKSEANEYELSRYACCGNVVGGFSKLLKYAINNYDIKKIITYADLRWSDSKKNVYLTNGFKEVRKSAPNYWYVPFGKIERKHRFQFRKSELKNKFPEVYDESLTEKQIMSLAKYNVIWDCGNIVFEYNVK